VKWNGGDGRRGEGAGKDMVRRDCNRKGMRQSEVTVFIFKIFGLVHPYTIVKLYPTCAHLEVKFGVELANFMPSV